ncbi:hypothetical protein BBK36DRAFT_1137078 [Trichoderma citrinoviride]|uniref:Uncharacterized protein n=1 Tax=Trichoderma citrinoviride TaxID=58853 RepID=A0A2T4BM69_9HYPO|nr:hypothetical protein BBK36DRAFT_1137078 [Trichoderma citrinoviride]PTB70408.1 hypothetical protein BBK36DRAFT_1137078 [Trichoderma citrinoviride]
MRVILLVSSPFFSRRVSTTTAQSSVKSKEGPSGPTLDRQRTRRVELAEAIEFVAGGSGTGSCGRELQARHQSDAGVFDLLAIFAEASSKELMRETKRRAIFGEWKQWLAADERASHRLDQVLVRTGKRGPGAKGEAGAQWRLERLNILVLALRIFQNGSTSSHRAEH